MTIDDVMKELWGKIDLHPALPLNKHFTKLHIRKALEAQEAEHKEAVRGIRQIVIEDVPHKYQKRLLKTLAEREG